MGDEAWFWNEVIPRSIAENLGRVFDIARRSDVRSSGPKMGFQTALRKSSENSRVAKPGLLGCSFVHIFTAEFQIRSTRLPQSQIVVCRLNGGSPLLSSDHDTLAAGPRSLVYFPALHE